MPLAAVLGLAVGSSCSAYDCEFVALAQDLGAPLVTVDRQVLASFPGVAVALEDYMCNTISGITNTSVRLL